MFNPLSSDRDLAILAVGTAIFNVWKLWRKEKKKKENIRYKAEQEAYYQYVYGVNKNSKK